MRFYLELEHLIFIHGCGALPSGSSGYRAGGISHDQLTGPVESEKSLPDFFPALPAFQQIEQIFRRGPFFRVVAAAEEGDEFRQVVGQPFRQFAGRPVKRQACVALRSQFEVDAQVSSGGFQGVTGDGAGRRQRQIAGRQFEALRFHTNHTGISGQMQRMKILQTIFRFEIPVADPKETGPDQQRPIFWRQFET